MKKFCLLLTLGAFVTLSAIAQNATSLKPFKVDVSVGYAIPGGSGSKGGVLFAIEPKYAVMSQLALGLRLEAAVMARGFANVETESAEVELDVKASSSYLLTGDYYFTSNYSFRPFGGIGAGIYSIAAASVSADDDGNATSVGSAGNKFGGLVRAGFEAGHFRLGIEYNLVPKTKIDIGSGESIESKNGYIGLKLGVCIGGGPRK